VAAIEAFIAHHDAKEARPFKWSRKPEDFMESWKRGYLHHVVRAREIIGSMLLTWHNLHFYQELMKGIRSAIAEGRMTGFASSMRDSLAAGDVDPIDLD
ncbi:MAG: hypothetical protein OXI81_13850, partial [Paracoccaceae bacterium]|nr:hypothetical protein [Paracoccaceae bacterium]